MSQAQTINARASWIHSSRLHVFMYAILLIVTPFILLRNYLVQAISLGSASSFSALGFNIKIVPAAALLALIAFLIIYRKRLTKWKLLAAAVVIVLNGLAQQITDYYFGHNFYDLQQNWHYIAYGLYAYMIYRDLAPRNLQLNKIMAITYFSALGLSLFDEMFQQFMSSRVFDICDIGKDVWGTCMGMILIYFSGKYSHLFFKDWKKIRHKKLRHYYRHPFTLMLLMIILTLIFLNMGSLLTEAEYAVPAAIMTVIVFSLFFTVFHFSQFKTGKIILLAIFIIAVLAQGFLFIKYHDKNITHTSYGLTIYKGIPIPFFDIMIYQNGVFRLVDKKHYFNQRDRQFFMKRKPDIILIASGAEGKGGKGFSDPKHLFVYNQWTQKATQVIIQKNPEACETFNRLKAERKKVIFIIHNTC